jgi:hypothetical protein
MISINKMLSWFFIARAVEALAAIQFRRLQPGL